MSELLLFLILAIYVCEAILEMNEPLKMTKTHTDEIQLQCLLTDKHDQFNKNSTITWWTKKCIITCKNRDIMQYTEWEPYDCNGPCKTTLLLDNSTTSSGYYMCKIFPYHTDERTNLQIEITKTFQLEIIDHGEPAPEILEDTSNRFIVTESSQVVLSCKCKSHSKSPNSIKWFKKKDHQDDSIESYKKNYIESSRAIKYFENFYEPLLGQGMKELPNNIFLSKLILNNVTISSVYVCVAINYYGFTYREISVDVVKMPVENTDDFLYDEMNEDAYQDFPEKDYELSFLIPVCLLIPIPVIMISTIIYLMIKRQMMKMNKEQAVWL